MQSLTLCGSGRVKRSWRGKGLAGWLSVSIRLWSFVTPFHSVPPLKPARTRRDRSSRPRCSFVACLTSIRPTFKVESTFHLPPWELELPLPSFSPLHCLRTISRHQRRSVAKLRLQSALPPGLVNWSGNSSRHCHSNSVKQIFFGITFVQTLGQLELQYFAQTKDSLFCFKLHSKEITDLTQNPYMPLFPQQFTSYALVPFSFLFGLSTRPDAPVAVPHRLLYCMSCDRPRAMRACHFLQYISDVHNLALFPATFILPILGIAEKKCVDSPLTGQLNVCLEECRGWSAVRFLIICQPSFLPGRVAREMLK